MKRIIVLVLFLGMISIGAARDRRISDDDGSVLNLSSSGALISSTGQSIVSGATALTLPGTAEVIGSSSTVHSVVLKAGSNNNSVLYIGNANVNSTNGFKLHTGVTVTIHTDDVADIFFDGDLPGDTVEFIGIVQ